MDALKFVRETNRMCKSFGDSCEDCPANDVSGCMVDQLYEEIVPIVEKWAKENPRKTRQDVFLEQWPETTPDEHGVMRWIPVTERLPEVHQNTRKSEAMLVYTRRKLFMVAIWNGIDWLAPMDFWDAWGDEIVYWMPLPEAPEEGDKT